MPTRRIALLDRVPHAKQARATVARVQELAILVKEALDVFDVKHEIHEVVEDRCTRIHVELEGEDEEPAINFLNVKFGVGASIDSVKPGDEIHRAPVVAPGSVGFGVFFDIGLAAGKQALYPLHRMREQLAGGKSVPSRPLVKAFGFCEGFAMPVVVTRVEAGKVEVELAARVVDELATWRRDGLDKITCHGEDAEVLERALREKLGVRHHAMVQQAGFLDVVISVDKRTDGAGIVALLGPLFSHVKLAVFNPRRIDKLLA